MMAKVRCHCPVFGFFQFSHSPALTNELNSSYAEPKEESIMDKDRIKGSAEQAKGKVKEAVGKVTGDAMLEGEGKADQAGGKIRNAVGILRTLFAVNRFPAAADSEVRRRPTAGGASSRPPHIRET